jgi:hypothetical protein
MRRNHKINRFHRHDETYVTNCNMLLGTVPYALQK